MISNSKKFSKMEKINDTLVEQQNRLCLDIKRFKIIKLIRKGGFGSVFLVQDDTSKLRYAAKVISYNSDETEYKTMINREIGNMIRAQHPTIIKLFGYSLQDFDGFPNVVIFMELAANGSLSEILQKARNKNPDKNVDNTVRQIILVGVAFGMMHLHQHKIIHRDLKPDNVLINENYQPCVTDFGLSKSYESGNSNPSRTCGTSVYKAPEVIKNRQYSEKSDVYSFAILMYEVLTDLVPFPSFLNDELTEFKFNEKVVCENFRPTFSVPIKKSFKELIEQCWSADPSERPSFEEIFHKLAFNIDDSSFDIFQSKPNQNNKLNVNESNKTESNKTESNKGDLNKNESNKNDLNKNESNKGDLDKNELCKNELIKSELIKSELSRGDLNRDEDEDVNKYYLDGVDVKKLLSYVDDITENNASKNDTSKKIIIEELQKENEKIKSQFSQFESGITIDSFNNLSLESQHLIVSEMIKNDLNEAESQRFVNLDTFLVYILNLVESSNEFKYIQIPTKSQDELLCNLRKGFPFLNRIYLLNDATEILYRTKSLNSPDFINNLSNFDDISIELKYPSRSFKPTYKAILNTKSSRVIKIVIYLTETDTAFKYDGKINSIKMDPSIETIVEYAFDGCSGLSSLILSDSLKSISVASFHKCTSLTQVVIPSSVEIIDSHAFRECSSLTEVFIPSSVTAINEYAFSGCSSLCQVVLPSSITTVKEYTFSECSSLAQVFIPSSVVSICEGSFLGCSSLRHVLFPDSLQSIAIHAFEKCAKLEQISIPASVKSIGGNAFCECSSLAQVLIHASITSIDEYTFLSCSSLIQISIPSSVTAIKKCAFSGCSSLEHIKIPGSVKSIGIRVFEQCTSLAKIDIPPSVTSMSDDAFAGCTSLHNISIPAKGIF